MDESQHQPQSSERIDWKNLSKNFAELIGYMVASGVGFGTIVTLALTVIAKENLNTEEIAVISSTLSVYGIAFWADLSTARPIKKLKTLLLMISKPTPADLAAAVNKTVPDLIAPNLKILFCGINPGLYTAATGWHFGRPGNRFWPALYASGLTPRLLHPSEQAELLSLGYGISNFVYRTTVSAAELTPTEVLAGAEQVTKTVLKYQPKFLAILGVSAYRLGFRQPHAQLGLQPDTIGTTKIWILPNPSGLNAHYTPQKLAQLFSDLKIAAS